MTSMLPDPPPEPVIAYPYTGDYRIDALLEGLQYRWNYGLALGTKTTVTYSFMTAKPFYGGTDSDGDYGFSEFTAQQKAAVRQILGRLDVELGITFTEVTDSTFSYGQVRFGNNTQSVSAGYSWLPYSTGDDLGGDVWIDDQSYGSLNPVAGSYAWATLVHEIGHALGLKHPGNYNAGSDPANAQGNYLGVQEDNLNYSIMSYREVAGGQERAWYGMYDLLTLKKLYGDGTWGAGDSTYAYRDSNGTLLEIIDDASGTDTIDLSGLTLGATVDLRPGGFSSVGRNGTVAASNNLSIELTTLIEKFIGSAYNDAVIGNDAPNTFTLGRGANTADGGAGIDTVVYTAPRSGFQVSVNAAGWHVTGTGIDDNLGGMERAQFSDRKLAFDLSGNAGIAAKVLGAVFGAASVSSHPDYAGIGLALLDGGMNYAGLVQYAIDTRLGAHTNGDVVTLLYTNVVQAPPPAGEYAGYLSQLDSGAQTQAGLGMFAADNALNVAHIGLTGLALTGLAYA